jgi:Kef-type K+ transport system membrane component KefB
MRPRIESTYDEVGKDLPGVASSSAARTRYLVPALLLVLLSAAIALGVVFHPSTDAAAARLKSTEPSTLFHVLLTMAAVGALAQVIGRAFARIRQPAVVGEMLAGIMLGPSLLGRVSPAAAQILLPPEVGPYVRLVAQIGVVLFMFLVGLELDLVGLRHRMRSAATISLVGIAVPLCIGAGAAVALQPILAPQGAGRLVFVAFFAVAMSVTAFPVLARIVAERNMQKSPLGVMALTCAAVDDASAWCLLAIVASLAGSRTGEGLSTLGLTALYVAFMIGIVRPLLARLFATDEGSRRLVPSVLLLLLVSALTTEWIGIHALFGAFMLGAIVPAEAKLAHRLTEQLGDLVHVVLLPVFFAFTGMRMQVGLLAGAQAWLLCGFIVMLAFVGKLGGVSIAARLLGVRWREATALGVLMNTRGLMELIVLNVGLDLGIISSKLFTMMVIMALLTTIAGGPLLDLIGHEESPS